MVIFHSYVSLPEGILKHPGLQFLTCQVPLRLHVHQELQGEFPLKAWRHPDADVFEHVQNGSKWIKMDDGIWDFTHQFMGFISYITIIYRIFMN